MRAAFVIYNTESRARNHSSSYDNATAADAVHKAFAAGITHIHSAFDYFNVQGVGQGLKAAKSREDFFITAMTTPCQHPAAPPIRNVTGK